MRGGSRFNLRYSGNVPSGLRAEDVMAALAEYVDFHTAAVRSDVEPAPPPAGDISLLRKGMLREDAEREFGRAVESSQRREGGLAIITLVFVIGEQRATADFVEGVLVRYTITSK